MTRFLLQSRPSAAGERVPLPNDQVMINPYTGVVQGERRWGDITQGKKNIMPFIYRLHDSLALGIVGTYTFGIVSLLWTLDCFVGAYLTFPARVSRLVEHRTSRQWFARGVRHGAFVDAPVAISSISIFPQSRRLMDLGDAVRACLEQCRVQST